MTRRMLSIGLVTIIGMFSIFFFASTGQASLSTGNKTNVWKLVEIVDFENQATESAPKPSGKILNPTTKSAQQPSENISDTKSSIDSGVRFSDFSGEANQL